MDSLLLDVVLWMLAAAIVLAAIAFVSLKWMTARVARAVADAAERRLAATLGNTFSRAGIRYAGVQDEALRAKYVAQIDRMARVMDRLVPLPVVGGVGLDAVLGLVPVVGDAVSLGISSLILLRAAQLGVPADLLSRLIAIQCTDLVLGAVPVLGDFIDVSYKADLRCASLIKDFLRSQGRRSP